MDDDLAVYEAIAAALATTREPDLSRLDSSRVATALSRALGSPSSRQTFLEWLDARTRMLSGDRVTIERRATPGRPFQDATAASPIADDDVAPELALRVVIVGEPFAEPVVIRADPPVVQFPMRH